MIFFGTVSPGGILELDHPDLYSDLLKGRLANCRVQLDIDRREAKRSLSQKAYYWMYRGVIGQETGDEPAFLHEYFKRRLLPPWFVIVRGEADFVDYLDKIAALTGVPVPDLAAAGYISNTAIRPRLSLDVEWTPSISFEMSTHRYRGGDWLLFRVDTCEGLWSSKFTSYEVLAVVNRKPSNGHFREAMLWFEASARRDHKWLKVRECWNPRAWMLWKHGFRWSPLFDWAKEFNL